MLQEWVTPVTRDGAEGTGVVDDGAQRGPARFTRGSSQHALIRADGLPAPVPVSGAGRTGSVRVPPATATPLASASMPLLDQAPAALAESAWPLRRDASLAEIAVGLLDPERYGRRGVNGRAVTESLTASRMVNARSRGQRRGVPATLGGLFSRRASRVQRGRLCLVAGQEHPRSG